MQRSAVFNMPMAIVVAKSWSKYLELPMQYKALCLGLWVERETEICGVLAGSAQDVLVDSR